MKRPFLYLLTFILLVSCTKDKDHAKSSGKILDQTTTVSMSTIELDTLDVTLPPEYVSTTGDIIIAFKEIMVNSNRVGKSVWSDPLQFEPALSGGLKWVDIKTLVFTPDQNLRAGQKYHATLYGDRIWGEERCSDSLTFSFTGAPQEIIDSRYSFVPVEGKVNVVQLNFTIEFADSVDSVHIAKELSLKEERAIPFTFSYGSNNRTITLVSSEVTRAEMSRHFTIALPGTYTARGNSWEKEAVLYGENRFEVLYHSDNSTPTEALASYTFTFSDPIQTNVDISEFVTITPEVSFETVVSGKQLTLNGAFDAGVYYKIGIAEGFPSSFGTKTELLQEYRMILSNHNPAIEWLSEGVLMPSDNSSKLQFRSMNVGKARVEVYEIVRDNMGFFLQQNNLTEQTNSSYYSSRASYSELNRVGEVIYTDTVDIGTVRNAWVNSELNLSGLPTRDSGSILVVNLTFNSEMLVGKAVSVRDEFSPGMLYYEGDNYYTNPAQYGFYYRNGTYSKLILHTDIALTTKESRDGLTAYAINVITARPEVGMKIGLYNYQNRKLGEATTGSDGSVHFPKDDEESPRYLLGESRSGMAVLKLSGSRWDYSSFETGGASVSTDGTELFLYADRGVHRPGDTIFLTGILRLNRELPPTNLPVKIQVNDAMGNGAYSSDILAGENGHFSWAIPTRSTDATGTWNATITVGDKQFFQSLPVEMVKPNRLKVTNNIPQRIDSSAVIGEVTTRYLFGTPAAGLEASARISLSPQSFRSSNYSSFFFDTPLRKYGSRSMMLYDGELDSLGVCSFENGIEGLDQVSSSLRGEVSLRVHERGGNVVEKRFNTSINPYTHYVGMDNPFQWRSAPLNEEIKLPIVSVNRDGEAVAGRRLRIRHYINKRGWWWDYDRNNRLDFRRQERTYLISTTEITSSDDATEFPLTIEDYGRHFMEVKDLESGHESGFFFWGSRWGRNTPEGNEEETYLPIILDANIYAPGDIATISCEAPDDAMVILAIEQDQKIIATYQGVAKDGKVSIDVPMTNEMMPNSYAVMQLIQPHSQTSNDMPQAMFGVQELTVEDPSTRLPITVTTPSEIRPEAEFDIEVGNSSNEDITVTITVVDEGLLDLTNFRSPDAWKHFYRKLRLAVTSRDNFGEFINALIPDMDHLFAIGGGMAGAREDRVGQNDAERFKPVVLHKEPLTIKANSSEAISFTMPNYMGEVRVMVVAAGEKSYADFAKQIPVKQPLIILPTLPRVVRPSDTFAIPVSVFAIDSTIRNASVTVVSSGSIDVRGGTQRVRFDGPGEEDVTFTGVVGENIGVDSVTITAIAGDETTAVMIELPIISANPFYTEVTDTMALGGSTVTLPVEPFGYEGTNKAQLVISRAPDIQIQNRIAGLIRYPYGCIEQTTSALLPQLVLNDITALSAVRKEMITDNINDGIDRLRRFHSGSRYLYWPRSRWYSGRHSAWGGLYAGHFLVLANKDGYSIPSHQMNHFRAFAKSEAGNSHNGDYRYRTYALFLLALDGHPQLGKMNLLKENYLNDLDPLSRDFLATAYHLAGRTDAATQVAQADVPLRDEDDRELMYTFASRRRDLALHVYLASLRGDQGTATSLIQTLGKQFRPGTWASTHETSIAILAFAQFYESFGRTGDAVEYKVDINGTTDEGTLHFPQKQFDITASLNDEISITSKGSSPLFVSVGISGTPKDNRIETESNGMLISRKFYTEDGVIISQDELEQGQPVWIEFKLQSEYREQLDGIALTMVLPAGWEIINQRFTGERTPDWLSGTSSVDYCDIRDDRISWFFDLYQMRTMHFVVKVNPTFAGTYTLPPVVAETMYSPEYFARIAAGETTVKK